MEQQTLPGIPPEPALTQWIGRSDPPMVGWWDYTMVIPPDDHEVQRRWWGGPILGWTAPAGDLKYEPGEHPPYMGVALLGWWRGLVEPADHYSYPLCCQMVPMKIPPSRHAWRQSSGKIARVPIVKPVARVAVLKE